MSKVKYILSMVYYYVYNILHQEIKFKWSFSNIDIVFIVFLLLSVEFSKEFLKIT